MGAGSWSGIKLVSWARPWGQLRQVYLATNGEPLIQLFPANFYPSRITRRKGKANDKDRKFQERIRGQRLTDEPQDTNNSIKGGDKQQKPGAVRERKRRRLVSEGDTQEWVSMGSSPKGRCLPAGISMDTVTSPTVSAISCPSLFL